MAELFATDPRVVLLGEDVLDPYGGAFKVTAGLSSKYPERVFTTPISEGGITGVAAGLALRGHVPLLEIMFGDFLTLCADQIVNHASKFPQMYPGVACPLVLRTPMGGGRGYGPTHSQSIEKMFLGTPGLKIIAPSHYHRPGYSLQRVVANESGPTLFIEHKLLYREPLQISSPDIPIETIVDRSGYTTAVVRNFNHGKPDVCLVTYGGCSRFLPELLMRMGGEEIRLVALLPESVDPVPVEVLATFAAQAGRVVVFEESADGFTWASGVASLLYPMLWGKLQCPIRIVASERCIIPTSFDQEAEVLVSQAKIEAAILEVLSWA